MTAHALVPHPALPRQAAVHAVASSVAMEGAVLRFEYRLSGELDKVVVPVRAPSQRADRLWEHTCFEAFVAVGSSGGYYELNFSPSSAWAAYELDGYRQGMRPLELPRFPEVEVAQSAALLRVTVAVEIAALAAAPWPRCVGLTAVVEDSGGGRGYYALRHTREKPDFHDAASFTVRLDGSAR